jgi:glycosyltransferase involved in cell wall biosynthesis
VKWVEKSTVINTFIAVSRFVNQIYRSAGIPTEKIKTLYNPVSLPESKPALNPDGKYVLFMGRLTEAKGTDILYRLILDNPDIKFKIAGDGPVKSKFENIIKSGRDNVELLGYISGENKRKILQNAKLVLIPSQWWETFGLVVIEANSFGKKVVAANTGGITELIEDGLNGYLCDPKDYCQFQQKVRTLFYEKTDLETQQQIQNRAYQFSVDNYTENLISLYEDVLSK